MTRSSLMCVFVGSPFLCCNVRNERTVDTEWNSGTSRACAELCRVCAFAYAGVGYEHSWHSRGFMLGRERRGAT